MVAVPELHWLIELEEIRDERVEMIGDGRIRLDRSHTGSGKVGLTTSATARVTAGPPRLIIDDPVSHGRFDLTQIGSRKVVAEFRQIIVGRVTLCSKTALLTGLAIQPKSGDQKPQVQRTRSL